MPSRLLVTAGVLCGVVLTAAAIHPPARATGSVNVDARCTGGQNTQVTVSPWNLRINQGDDVQWTLNASANTTSITITPKNTATWPFATNRGQGTKTTPAASSGMRAGASGRHAYSIQLVCQVGNNPPDSVLIDPDVIVD